MEVELDAFSGRPNPRWELTPAEAESLLAAFRGLQPESRDTRVPDGLGYRGFIVRTGEGELRVFRDTVFRRRGDRVEVFADPERVLERVLVESARAHVPGYFEY